MKYIVKLDYKSFEFDDFEEAGIFASTAKKHFKSYRDYDSSLDVTIEILSEDESKTDDFEVPQAE